MKFIDIDDYINKALPFAQPILKHFRELVHQACTEVEESLKWNSPYFSYKGMLCGMAAFKEHCAFSFWKGAILDDPDQLLDKDRKQAMGQFGRIAKLKDLPSDQVIISYIKEAMRLNAEGIKNPGKTSIIKKELIIPEDFMESIKKNESALVTFRNLSFSKQRDYVDWVQEAKQPETRKKRITLSLEWLTEGKSRHWKYEK
jgi:uncharacterized protein YdeI (YjbR/CyaY-like superfamily)